jgi:CheY-like chemotaxis protein
MSGVCDKSILIVDDEPVTQLMVTMILQRNNYKVFTAYDGQDALNLLNVKDVDLIVTDINMPNMNGMSLLQKLRQDGRYQNLPVILFTAQGQRELKNMAISTGATGFLTKPFSSGKLVDLVSKYLCPSPN